MKLILLPGMDGTGKLFSPLLSELSEFDCEVIKLPETGSQDYASIVEQVASKLPKEDFILIAESFSGPIGLSLAKKGIRNLKAIIFVATFLSPPNKMLLAFARLLPLKLLSGIPTSKFAYKALFLGGNADSELLELFQSVLNSLPSALIKARLKAMSSLSFRSENIEIPAAYIQAASDKLVSAGKAQEFVDSFSNMTVSKLEGPHFILQARPAECALIISGLVTQLVNDEPAA